MKTDKEAWLKEYTEFVKSDGATVPTEIFMSLKSRLFPNPWIVFGKILGIHSVVGFLSLGICNQFGLNPFGTEHSLMNWFMRVGGHNFCMLACGIFFMTTTYLISNVMLGLEELETIRRYGWLQTGVLGLVSLAAFYFFGADLVATFAGLWILGAFIGAFAAIEGSYRLRRQWA
ncbi:MAG: hypothetical protein K1X29_02605 [Bdellovibrionales bacterium]|nr:hypothetical protein [Bdellovibrionales bacterium]